MKLAQSKYVPGTSRPARSSRTLALRMALELQHQQEVAERIKELRGKVPQPVIADRVGVTLRAYQEWEAGGGIKWENYGKLALALGSTVEYLMHGEDAARAASEAPRPGQLDRIEAKLDDLLARLPATPSDEVVAEVEAAGQQRDQQQTSPARASSRKKGSGRAA